MPLQTSFQGIFTDFIFYYFIFNCYDFPGGVLDLQYLLSPFVIPQSSDNLVVHGSHNVKQIPEMIWTKNIPQYFEDNAHDFLLTELRNLGIFSNHIICMPLTSWFG